MKHCDYFKGLKGLRGLRGLKGLRGSRGLRGSFLLTFSTFLTFSTLLTGCVKHDEIAFRGTIVDVRECNASFGSTQDAGFVVDLSSPDSIGVAYTVNGAHYSNAVILYDPGCRLYKGDKLSGTFYLDDKYSRANCSIHWSDLHLPEGVFLDISVE